MTLPQRDDAGHDCGVTFVPIPASMLPADFDPAHAEYGVNDAGQKCFAIDSCIVPALLAVWAAGYRTLGCCCGHGQHAGGIITLDTMDCGDMSPSTSTKERYARTHARARETA